MHRKLYVGNLSSWLTDGDLLKLFGPFGTVASVKVVMDLPNGRSKGFAFVEMNNPKQAAAAITGLNGQTVAGRSLSVISEPPGNRPPPTTTSEEQVMCIRLLGQRIEGHIQFMCTVAEMNGTSREAKQQGLSSFCHRLEQLEQELGRIKSALQLA